MNKKRDEQHLEKPSGKHYSLKMGMSIKKGFRREDDRGSKQGIENRYPSRVVAVLTLSWESVLESLFGQTRLDNDLHNNIACHVVGWGYIASRKVQEGDQIYLNSECGHLK